MPLSEIPSPSERPRPVDRWNLWFPIALAVALGAVLLATVLLVRAEIGEAARLTTEAQIDGFARDVRATMRRTRGQLTDEDLAAILEDHREDGLRYVAVRHRGLDRTAGEALGTTWTQVRGARVGDRVRSVHTAGPRRGRRGHRGHAGRAVVALEFEPLQAERLRGYADAVLWVALAAVFALLTFAGLFSRSLRQRERQRVDQEGQRRLAALGTMSAVMAHEVRNPLTSIKGNAQLLVELMADQDPNRERAELLVEETVRLQTLTNDLLEFARSSDLRMALVDPRDVATAAIAAVGEDSVNLVVDDDTPQQWPVDSPRIQQALVNLIQNAVEAAPQSRPQVALSGSGGGLEIRVSDQGPGIPEADRARVFEPFFTSKTQGVGLGLAIAKRVVDLHGGELNAANADGGGAVFTMTLPHKE